MNQVESVQVGSEEPLYNIGAVARMTGIPVATLRIWERRYGFPRSARTAGGHRLYSEKEVMRLRWVKTRSDEGMQTGQAIRALLYEEREGHRPESLLVPPAPPRRREDQYSLGVMRERLSSALLAHDTDKAEQILGEAMAVYPLEDLVLDVVRPVFVEIGEAWESGRVSVAMEHLGTNFLRHKLLMWMEAGPLPYGVRPIMLACAPEELHEGSLLILGVLLRRRRWPVAYLGQTMPLDSLAALILEMKPPAVVIAAMMEQAGRALLNWQDSLGEYVQAGRPVIGFGGKAFNDHPDWRDQGPGIFLGSTLQEGVDNLERLLREVTPVMA